MALQDEAVIPTVVANADAARGVLPLAHTSCTIVKIHGDYLDARIRNTTSELAAYEPELDRLLDRIFDEYGLVVCGWSAEWDPALCAAIERCSSHRFTTYWATRNDPSDVVQRLLQLRRAVVVSINDADSFFIELEEKVAALARVDAPHPLSPRLAAETVKRYLPEPSQRIRLYDTVSDEVGRVEAATLDAAFPTMGEPATQESMIARLERYESITATLVKMLAVGGYWGEREHNDLWSATIDRLANRHTELGGRDVWLKLRQYPAVLALYGLGLGAVAAAKLDTLSAVLSRVKVREHGQEQTLAEAIPIARVVEERLLQPEGQPRVHTPASNRLCDLVLREPLREFLPHQQRYEDAFDRFEYLISLVFADTKAGNWAPAGAFAWRQKRREDSVYASVEAEARAAGSDWPLLSHGLFQGSLERFLEVKVNFDQIARQAYW